ncbi:MAG: phosphate ABC transporter substrate-binding protein [Chloroherpetonaceae bacterium]|nr:phosphate ABC transporter substrate-binding protein [Chloroherpetonaceae bacterium]MCS7211629.1 phosphate ABC transporter substrate-binding protein [Chloroherpetonaceae bacterium]MDW8019162.1 phosphate ABC transporter substrate-binding protein [Chloroherpetonaceae bacterium]
MLRLRSSLLLCFLLWLCSCHAPDATITIRGSDTMVALGQKWAEIYMSKFPDETVQVNGGGSGTGIAALINRTADICQSSRPMKPKERQRIREKFGRDVIEIPVAKDGIVIYVNERNPIAKLSLSQLRQIYTGKIQNWKELGWEDQRIIVYGRENSSGTYEFFKKEVLKGDDFAAFVQTLPGTAAIVNAVSKDVYAIGYGGNAYSRGIRLMPISRTDTSAAIEANEITIAQGTYPISRNLYFYLAREPNPTIQRFLDWVLSAEAQSIVAAQGFFPVKGLVAQLDSARSTSSQFQ